MKPMLFVVLCLVPFYSPAQYADDSATNNKIRLLLDRFAAGTMDSLDRQQITSLTYAIQNKGFYYGEPYKARYDSSLREVDKALLIWTALRDTANQANLRKYRSFVLGKLKKFDTGKKEAREAIRLYRLIKRPAGVAVSQFDLSLVFMMASEMDSSIYFGRIAYKYFLDQKLLYRSFICGNQLLQNLGRQRRYKEALVIHTQLQTALSAYKEHLNKLELKQIADFYYLSRFLYQKLGQNGKSKEYYQKWENLSVMLTDQGVLYASDHPGF